MEPWEYCQQWVKRISPETFGYRAECVRELVKATFGQYKFDTINRGWGAKFEKRPEGVLELLEASHTLRTMQKELVATKAKIQEIDADVSNMLQVLNKILHKH